MKSIRTSVYKPTTNSQCERTNRSIISILRKFVCDNPKNWSKNLCYVTYVINTSVSESTKASLFSLIYGTEATSVLDLCLPEVPENVPKTIEHAYKYWFDNMTLLRKLARENMICAKQKQKIQYDRHTRPHNFIVGDKVFIKIHRLKDNDDDKLRPQYKTFMCSLVYHEIINHYMSNNSNVYSCLLDASKAFDKVHYGKLFHILLN